MNTSKTHMHESIVEIRWKVRDRERTWPPTTAMAGRESQRVGNALSSPWSPRAVQALWILFTNDIRFSILGFGYRWRRRASKRRDDDDGPAREKRRERERGELLWNFEMRLRFEGSVKCLLVRRGERAVWEWKQNDLRWIEPEFHATRCESSRLDSLDLRLRVTLQYLRVAVPGDILL